MSGFGELIKFGEDETHQEKVEIDSYFIEEKAIAKKEELILPKESKKVNIISKKPQIKSLSEGRDNIKIADNIIRKLATISSQEVIKKELIKAIDLYKAAILINPRSCSSYIGLSYISFISDDKNMALGLINQALKIEPLNPRAKKLKEKIELNFKTRSFK